jgi:CrcB protein
MTETHPLIRLETLALVGVGGFAGSNLRYFAALVVPGPLGTLAVNAVGSFVLGFVLYEAAYTGLLSERTRVVLATGFLSSLTTYSTFAVQTAQLAAPVPLVANVVANYALGFVAVLLGRELARSLAGDGSTSGGNASGRSA